MVKHKSASRCLIDCVCIKGDGFRYCVIQVQSKEITYIQLFFCPAEPPVRWRYHGAPEALAWGRTTALSFIRIYLAKLVFLMGTPCLFDGVVFIEVIYWVKLAVTFYLELISKQSLLVALLSINLLVRLISGWGLTGGLEHNNQLVPLKPITLLCMVRPGAWWPKLTITGRPDKGWLKDLPPLGSNYCFVFSLASLMVHRFQRWCV